jgi:hypothetical protein
MSQRLCPQQRISWARGYSEHITQVHVLIDGTGVRAALKTGRRLESSPRPRVPVGTALYQRTDRVGMCSVSETKEGRVRSKAKLCA